MGKRREIPSDKVGTFGRFARSRKAIRDAKCASRNSIRDAKTANDARGQWMGSESTGGGSGVERGLDGCGAVAVKAGGGDGLGETDAHGNEDGAGIRSVGHGD